jgi:hypothetical protein
VIFSEYNHWQLHAQNSAVTSYYLDIYDQGTWLTLGTMLGHDVNEEQDAGDFYGSLLNLNAQINGASIGRDSGMLMLTREQPKRDLTMVALAESLFIINSVHEYIYPQVYELIGSLNLRANN